MIDPALQSFIFHILTAYANKDDGNWAIVKTKLPVFTTEEGISTIKRFFGKLNEWKNISELIPGNFKSSINLKKTGQAGILAGSLELVKEGNVSIKQNNLFDDIYIKEN